MSDTMQNPLIHRDRRLGPSASEWVRSFAVTLKPLIVCRGPIRKEAIDIFQEMGMTQIGILLSDKDSIVYSRALAPELRLLPCERVHRVTDYSGASKEERQRRIAQIIDIARTHGYDSIFAGYGFMAEDDTFVRAIEDAGLTFIGPCAHTVKSAGLKDEAKRTALAEKVSVTPGVNNVTSRLLLSKYPDVPALKQCVEAHQLPVAPDLFTSDRSGDDLADAVLAASYAKGVDLYTTDELGAQIEKEVAALFEQFPHNRIRLKAIGGGGGKGQRILPRPVEDGRPIAERAREAAAESPALLREILPEVGATGVGDNKNVLIELNIEQTRHNEIQLLGNGEWCIALGGRDCSLQMHEQKLLEVSVTQEGLQSAIASARGAGRQDHVDALEMEVATLGRMESEGERFGRAVRLDSASTFECIVERDRHYFMEVNTRIQVEHRVTELCYRLRFRNPTNPTDFFDVESLVEAMALLAQHKQRLPRPERLPRKGASVEARLNATDASLSPHAGGMITNWSDPVEGEIRDDQGICTKNPDTGQFMHYKVAGAYDSNIALLVTIGDDRAASYERLADILRVTRLRGRDLETNLEFHYGLVHWFLRNGVWAKPTTRFVSAYLAQVGLLKEEADRCDVLAAWKELTRYQARTTPSQAKVYDELMLRKQTMVVRPITRLIASAHVLAGWLSAFRDAWRFEGERVVWRKNPLELLKDTYHFLNMDLQEGTAPQAMIWEPDHQLIETGLAFYRSLQSRLNVDDFGALQTQLGAEQPPAGIDAALWSKIQGAHEGHQLGLPLLGLLALIGRRAGFDDIRVNDDLTVDLPERLLDPKLHARMKKVLVPPPPTRSDEIVAVSGGMFYSQEAPDRPKFVTEGSHFEAGQPLYIIEVMKMFNRVNASFSGTIEKILLEGGDGTIVKKGQPLFKVRPDEQIEIEDPAEVAARRKAHTADLLPNVV